MCLHTPMVSHKTSLILLYYITLEAPGFAASLSFDERAVSLRSSLTNSLRTLSTGLTVVRIDNLFVTELGDISCLRIL